MASTTEICNLAISHLGIGKLISNLDTDTSDVASACRVYYEIARDTTLRDFNWPFATKIRAIALIKEDPNDEWDYSYRYPTDCLRAVRILSGDRNDTHQSRIPYKITNDDSGLIIYTDEEDAELEYVVKMTDPTLYQTDFTLALSYKLAFMVAARLTAGDPYKLAETAARNYSLQISRAMANAINEEQPDQEVESEFIRAR